MRGHKKGKEREQRGVCGLRACTWVEPDQCLHNQFLERSTMVRGAGGPRRRRSGSGANGEASVYVCVCARLCVPPSAAAAPALAGRHAPSGGRPDRHRRLAAAAGARAPMLRMGQASMVLRRLGIDGVAAGRAARGPAARHGAVVADLSATRGDRGHLRAAVRRPACDVSTRAT
jgi:hypothetical protein